MVLFANRVIGGRKVPCMALYIVAVFAIVTYGLYIRKHRMRDVLERKVIDHPSVPGFDGWAVTHFFFFMAVGFLYPGRYVQALAVSLGWETIEHMLGQADLRVFGRRLQLVGAQDADGNPVEPAGADQWWYGRFVTDNSFNLSGYILGSWLGQRYWPEATPPPQKASA